MSTSIDNTNQMIDELIYLQDEFYNSSRKNIFFKKSQKLKCAQSIADSYNISDLINHTCYIIPGSRNKVFFDYRVFKLYATPENYRYVISQVMSLFDIAIENTGSYEFHINLIMFSATAAERYKNIIDMFCNECASSNTLYSELLTNFYAYNTPGMIDIVTTILKRWTPPIIQSKLVLYQKNESFDKLSMLLFRKISNSDIDVDNTGNHSDIRH